MPFGGLGGFLHGCQIESRVGTSCSYMFAALLVQPAYFGKCSCEGQMGMRVSCSRYGSPCGGLSSNVVVVSSRLM